MAGNLILLNAPGPQGPPGKTGPQGPTGAQGPAGSALAVSGTGFVHWSGTAADATARAVNLASNGANGDVTGLLATANISPSATNGRFLATRAGFAQWDVLSAADLATAAGGVNGQVFITSGTAAVWTSLVSVETIHGRFTSGGSGTDFFALMGPYPSNETTDAALFLLGNGKATNNSNFALAVGGGGGGIVAGLTARGGSTIINAPGSGGSYGDLVFANANGNASTLELMGSFDGVSGVFNAKFGYSNGSSGNYGSWAYLTGVLNLAVAATNYIALTPAAAATIIFTENATTSAKLGYAARSSDAATHNLTIQGQYAFATATGTNRTPGNVVFDIGAPTNGSTAEAYFQFTRNGSTYAQIGTYPGSTTYGQLWLGNATAFTPSNPAVTSDANTFTYLNAPNGTSAIGLISTNATILFYIPSTQTSAYFAGTGTNAPLGVSWATSTAPTILSGTNATQLTVGTNKAGASLVLQADNAVTVLTLTTLATFATKVRYAQVSAPTAPPAGNFDIYMDQADGKLKAIAPSGNITTLAMA